MTELELLREVADVPTGDEVERHARAVAHARLRATIAAPPRPRRPFVLRVAPLVLAAAAAAVLVAIAWPRGDDVERTAGDERAVPVATPQPPQVLPEAGQYFYLRALTDYTITPDGKRDPRRHQAIREVWLAPDGSGKITSRTEGGEGGRAENFTIPFGGEHRKWGVYAGDLSLQWDALLALPPDVDALARYIDKHAKGSSNHREAQFTLVGDLLRETPVPPHLSSALFEVAQRIPGVETAPAEDQAGRAGTRVSYTQGRLREDLIFDDDGVLLGEQDVVDGKVTGWAVVEERGVVDALGARPAA
jgi:hypothetical protein